MKKFRFLVIVMLSVLVLIFIGCSSLGPKLTETVIGEYQTLENISLSSVSDNMVLIEGGTFLLRIDPQNPEYKVSVGSFYMSKYEVTLGEFRRFVNSTDYKPTGETYGYTIWASLSPSKKDTKTKNSWSDPYLKQEEDHPVIFVSWIDAIEYCNWLSLQENLTPAYTISFEERKYNVVWDRSSNGYRLPTLAEWEYACRAGTTTLYYYGDTPDVNTGWYKENSDNTTHSVGSMPPNLWGLYDMQGNAIEWVWDWYSTNPKVAEIDPYGPEKGNYKQIKGISFLAPASKGSSIRRLGVPSFVEGWNEFGFRVVRR
jgi:formylglycine-generating enzyme required for sulfatase activity